MKTRSVVLTMLLLIIFGGILEYNYIERKETNNVNTNIVTANEKLDIKSSTKKSKKKKVSVKKATKKKTIKKSTKKRTTKKKVIKKSTKKKSTKKKVIKKKTTKKRKSTKRSSNAEIRELQAYAEDLVLNHFGWSRADFDALVKLWYRESGWNVYAYGNGCYGIPQARPGKKMSSEGKDWKTNGRTQIRWGLNYIAARYGNPSKALKHSDKYHWY